MRVLVEADLDAVSRRAARIVADAISSKPDSILALPTGHTPLRLYAELVRMHNEEGLDFSRITALNLDEYIGVSPTDERSFHHYLWSHFFSHLYPLPAAINLLSFTADEFACSQFEIANQKAGGIDLLIAGVGTNGHIAFNEPGTPLDSRTRIVCLAGSTREKLTAEFSRDEIPTHAVTLGMGTILEAKAILVLASGSSKQKAVEGLLKGPVSSQNPVSAIRLHGSTTVILDQEAAGSSESLHRS